MSIVALIPARGGSKRIPGKNLAACADKPLLAWTAEAASASRRLDRALLSTDDEEIARVGRELGLEVPFLRPAEISGDAVPMAPVMQHALEWLRAGGEEIEAIVLLQPSSPLRLAAHIDAAIDIFLANEVETVVSVVEAPHIFHPMKALRLRGGRLETYCPDREQETDPAYGRNGPAVLVNQPEVIARGARYGDPIMAYVMPAEYSIDIDEPFDLLMCDLLLRHRLEQACLAEADHRSGRRA